MTSLRQLEYLEAIDQTRHFRKAAEKIGVGQPTLSTQIGALERKLGVQLVERSRSAVLLTPIGEKVLSLGRIALRSVREIEELAASHRGDFGRMIRLGLPPTIGPYLLPRMLPQLHSDHPDLKIYLREEVPSSLSEALAEGVYDAIISPLPVNRSEFQSLGFCREPLFIVVSQDHPFAKKGFVARSDLKDLPVLALEHGHQLHEQVEAICEEYGARPLFDFGGTSLETLRQMTALGMGATFLPGFFVRSMLDDRSGVVALELKGRALYRTVGLVWRRTSSRDPEYRLLLDYLRRTVETEFSGFTTLKE